MAVSFAVLNNQLRHIVEEAERRLIGQVVQVIDTYTEADGRVGKITAVIASGVELAACVMIYNKREPTEFLNSEPWTRTFWPIKNIRGLK